MWCNWRYVALAGQIWIEILQQILSRFWSFIWHRSTRCCTKAASFQTLQPGVFLKKMQLSYTIMIATTYSFDIDHQDRLTNKLVLGTPSAGILGGWATIQAFIHIFLDLLSKICKDYFTDLHFSCTRSNCGESSSTGNTCGPSSSNNLQTPSTRRQELRQNSRRGNRGGYTYFKYL